MRLLLLNPFFFPYAGGTERRLLEIGRRLAARHEVHVVTAQLPGTPVEEERDGLHVHRLPSRFPFQRFWNPPLVRTRGVARILKDLAPDLVDFHYRWAPSYARAFRNLESRVARCFTYNNSYGEGTGWLRAASLANDAWTRRWIQRADRIVAVSGFVRDELIRRRFPPDRIRIVPNGVDAAALHREAKKGHVPPSLEGQRFLSAVGRLVPIKGYGVLIEALSQLPKDLHVAICGEGPERNRLMRLSQRLGLRNRVHLLGWVPEPDKLALVRDSVAFVHPTRFEAFGLAPLEAMALGVPVVASGVGGLPELVGSGGFLAPVGHPDALGAVITTLTGDASERRKRSQAAQKQAAVYSWDAAARAAETTYLEASTSGKRFPR